MKASRQRNNMYKLQYTINGIKVPQNYLQCDHIAEVTTENIKALHSLDNLYHEFLPSRSTFDNTYFSSFIDLEAYTGYGQMLSGTNVKSSNVQLESSYSNGSGQANVLIVLVYDICYYVDPTTKTLAWID